MSANEKEERDFWDYITEISVATSNILKIINKLEKKKKDKELLEANK